MRIFIFIFLMIASLPVKAQSLRDLFVEMPDSVLSILTKVNRADFGDFLDSDMQAIVKNRLGKKSEMKMMTADYLLLELTKASKLAMKYLTVDDSTRVICVAKTYLSPVPDTQLLFYNEQWEMLPTSRFISLPKEEDYYRSLEHSEENTLPSALPSSGLLLQEAVLNSKEDELVFKYTSLSYIEKKEAETLKTKLKRKQIVYKWENGKFVMTL